jgi:hypothetical protein
MPTPTQNPIRPASDLVLGELDADGDLPFRLSVMVAGFPGTGKTRFAATWPEPVFIIFDPARESLRPHRKKLAGWCPIDGYDTWKTSVLPSISNREIAAKTIVIDTWTAYGRKLERHIRGGMKRFLKGYDDYEDYRCSTLNDIEELLAAKEPKVLKDGTTHPGYHIVVNFHLEKETDERGNLLGYALTMKSKLKNQLSELFGCCFLAVVEQKAKKTGNPPRVLTWKEWYMQTVPPSTYYTGMKDAISGGDSGLYPLPPRVPNDFPSLVSLWMTGELPPVESEGEESEVS